MWGKWLGRKSRTLACLQDGPECLDLGQKPFRTKCDFAFVLRTCDGMQRAGSRPDSSWPPHLRVLKLIFFHWQTSGYSLAFHVAFFTVKTVPAIGFKRTVVFLIVNEDFKITPYLSVSVSDKSVSVSDKSASQKWVSCQSLDNISAL